MRYQIVLVIILSCLGLSFIKANVADDEFLNFRQITPDEGLSHIQATSVVQDKKGYMWFGTNYGLDRYDGFEIETFISRTSDSLSISSSRIDCMLEDSRGNFWIGTKDGGLNRFSNGYFEAYREDAEKKKFKFSSNNISTIYEDSDSLLWVGAWKGGLNLFDYKTNTFRNFKAFDKQVSVTSVLELNHRFLLVGTRSQGLLIFDKDKFNFTPLIIQFENGRSRVSNILDIVIFNGKIWLASDYGLYHCEIASYQQSGKLLFKQYTLPIPSTNRVNTLFAYENNLWCGTARGLVCINYCEDEDQYTHQAYLSQVNDMNSLVGNYINEVYVDRSGVLWVATSAGISYCNLFSLPISNRSYTQLSNNLINCIFEDSYGQMWIGLQNGNLCKYIVDEDRLVSYPNQRGKTGSLQTRGSIDDIAEDDFGNIWIASWGGGLNKLNLEDERKGRPYFTQITRESKPGPTENLITAIEYHKGALYVGTYRNGMDVLTLNDKGEVIKVKNHRRKGSARNQLVSNTINSLYNDTIENCLWISTPEGLSKYTTTDSLKFFNYTSEKKKNRLSHNFVWEVCRTSPTQLFVGTIEDGLNKLVFNENMEQVDLVVYRQEDGLPSNSIQSILFDEQNQNLWIGGKGISRFNVENGKIKTFDITDGVSGNFFRVGGASKSRSGNLYFGSNKGLNLIKPYDNGTNPFTPEVQINSFLLFGKKVQMGEEYDGKVLLNKAIEDVKNIELKHYQNNISLEFIALHYANAQKNKYEYMLEGFDEEWMPTIAERRFATYSNLSHGNYTFKVRVANSDGVWNETPSMLHINILRPWWLTWWAYVLYLFAISGVWYIIFLALAQRQKILKDLEFEKLKTEKNEELTMMKIRFFTNISHELRTPLTLIVDPLESILKMNNLEENVKYYLKTMHRNAERLLRLFNQLLDFRKVETGNLKLKAKEVNIVSYIKTVASSFNYAAKTNNIDFAINTNVDKLEAWIDKDFVEKMLYNLLSNSFKHTAEGGTITVDLNAFVSKGEYQIKVADSGVGIDESEHQLVFESFYQSDHNEKRGTGIGLALVKRLVELHHGTISLRSKVNEGTSFTITLPLGDAFLKEGEKDVDDFEKLAVITGEEDTKASKSDKPVIIVAEDNQEMADYLKRELSEEYTIHPAFDGKQAYDMVGKLKPDLILSDVLMPKMDGFELCEKLKSKAAYSQIPIILISAKATDQDKLEGTERGADAYIFKPFKLDYLHTKIKKLIEDRKKMKQFFAAHKEAEDFERDPEREDFLQQAEKVVMANIETEDFDSQEFAKAMNMTYSTLYNKLKEYADCSVSGYMRMIRLKEAARLIANTSMTITQVVYQVGFNDAKYFRENFKKFFGVSPSVYLKNYRKAK
ncbi:MAG: ATP-binding protein [Bacteroidales bacterium]|nr:ATP-binding protein [Bacteroidales bacterium]